MDHFDVPLDDGLRAHLDGRVGATGFPDAGTYIRALIERDRAEIEELREEIRRGDESGVSPRTVQQIVEGAFREYDAARA